MIEESERMILEIPQVNKASGSIFCDWYLEMCKYNLYGKFREKRAVGCINFYLF